MGYSIYIAEDDKKIRELIHRFLESDGYAVTSFENGDELLTAFRKNPADLVILDIMMPGRTGTQVCADIRQQIERVYRRADNTAYSKGFRTGLCERDNAGQ